jgi:hypothetical protein
MFPTVFGSGFKWVNGSGSRQEVVSQKRIKCRNFLFEEFSVGLEAYL